jgi:site-specific DNA-methyltransferase (adenine-specific)
VQIIWGGNYYPLPPTRGWLSWFKPDAPPSMAHFELAWTNQDRNARQISCSIGETNAERVGHPTQKPLGHALVRRAGRNARRDAGPLHGQRGPPESPASLGLRFVGVEINPEYFALACKRIEDAQRQERMFA